MENSKSKVRLHIAAISLVIFLLTVLSYRGGLFTGFENMFEDLLFSPKAVDERIVILAIDNDSLQKIGQWPWARSVYANAFENLNKYPPEVVGLDVIFADPSSRGKQDDEILADRLGRLSYPVIIPVEAEGLSLNSNPPAIWASWTTKKLIEPIKAYETLQVGHTNLVSERDGVIRKFPPSIGYAFSETGFSERKAFARIVAENSNGFRLSDSKDERIVFAGPPGTVPRVSISRVVEGEEAILKSLENKIVLIGSTASDLHDEQPTPVSRGTLMSGVEIQAQIVNMLLKNYRLLGVPASAMILILLLAILIPTFLFIFVRKTYIAVLACVLVGILYVPLTIIFFDRGYVINFIHLALAWILTTIALFGHRYTTVDKERRQMRHAFSKYVSRDVLNEIMSDPSKVKLGGEEKEATVFFSDVRGFTTLSETLTPTELTTFLNKYLTVMTDIVLDERGVVDKYIGDAIMGFWGAPIQTETHAIDAVRAALIMVDALEKFNKDSAARGDLQIDIGIGLNSGKVTAGNMGSDKRFDYTVMGDTVNLASRLEGQTKSYTIHILISEFTRAMLSDETLEKEGIVIREIDQIKVKGKKKPVRVFQVVDRAKAEGVKKILPEFEALRVAYYAGMWDECLKLGDKILAQIEDGPTKALVDRTKYFIEHPPENWEGVYELKTK
ncbi:MAG: adenylate/guanylate cyclase domain-containing protein [Candidatus Vogelbacteria bacterium]|nr:adenylate/guanylate cyclase domain-containing protein [Candidatus Vogelbacteria bacterium]